MTPTTSESASGLTTDINKMYRAFNTANFLAKYGKTISLKEAAAKSLFENELDRRWKLFLEAAKKAGYKRIILGPSEHSRVLTQGNMVFAEPNIGRKDGWGSSRPPLWGGMCDILGGMGCGNGFGLKAVQAQLKLPSSVFKKYQGVHDL